MSLITSPATILRAPVPNVFQRAMTVKDRLGLQQATTMPMFTVPQRVQADQADWWVYPAELDYALWQTGWIPIRAVHWPTVAAVAGSFDRLFMAHEMRRGAEFTEHLATAPTGFVQVSKSAKFLGVALAPYAPANPLNQPAIPHPDAGYDPILLGVITDGRTGVFMPIASWTWR